VVTVSLSGDEHRVYVIFICFINGDSLLEEHLLLLLDLPRLLPLLLLPLVLLIRIILLQLASVDLLLFELNDLVLELLDEFAPVAANSLLGLALVQTLLVLVVFAVVLIRPLSRREKV
jgi:hypothetical protein